ncbi:MmyB family transcriptional regulator [Nonomuraea gerenzanensis]|uniref:Putative DNA-binding protein n=1 Tax=Nonomuraea gerenzanensis TaxID=93944 RepID=A0A1M4DYF5_9ACTN|nr:hypothetical protein [Nonomuraea gerenzanensis]UBU13913.1 hypothetical protein LCN96_02425 [Nonomuraea gerenzanensis]SBO91594.1 putative DNA-binding protein [Nonomuraea gerenzanensis]
MLHPERFVVTAVTYLRLTLTRYPDASELRGLMDELVAGSEVSARMWHSHAFHIDRHLRQQVRHPQLGPIELDFDILTVPEQEQQVVIRTADPDSPAYRSLQLPKRTEPLAPVSNPA